MKHLAQVWQRKGIVLLLVRLTGMDTVKKVLMIMLMLIRAGSLYLTITRLASPGIELRA